MHPSQEDFSFLEEVPDSLGNNPEASETGSSGGSVGSPPPSISPLSVETGSFGSFDLGDSIDMDALYVGTLKAYYASFYDKDGNPRPGQPKPDELEIEAMNWYAGLKGAELIKVDALLKAESSTSLSAWSSLDSTQPYEAEPEIDESSLQRALTAAELVKFKDLVRSKTAPAGLGGKS